MKAWIMSVRPVAPVVLLCCLAFATQSARAQQTFSYPNFNSTAGIQLNGVAAAANNGTANVLRVTPGNANVLGTAFYATPFPVTAGFTTTFTFQFTGQGGDGGHADGIAFLVQNAPAGNMASGVLGGSIGYGDDDDDSNPTAAISNSLAIELDTYDNPWDPNDNHVAIQSCGTGNNTQHHNKTCPNSGLNSTLAINSTINTNLTDGAQHTVIITYGPPCAGCLNLTVSLDGAPAMAVAFDITTLGLGANGSAYVGFTASTGGGFENQDVISWSFSSQTITLPVSTTAPTTFDFSNTQGSVLTHTVDFTPPGGNLFYPLNDPNTIQIQSTNTSVNSTTWPQYVTGGPLSPSTLFPMVDDNTGGLGTNGGLFVDLCFDPTLSGSALVPSDANCPFVPSGSNTFLGINVVADLVAKPSIAPGTTSVLAHYEPNTTGTTTWSPSTINGTPNPACVVTLGSPSSTQPASPTDCDVLDIQQSIGGDQTTSSGRAKGKGTFAFAYNVPMLLTTVSVNGTQINNPPANNNSASAGLWFSAAHAPLNLGFLVNPACPAGSVTCPAAPTAANNYFSAAPVAGETFDITNLAGTSVVVATTPGTPPVGFNTATVQPVMFTGSVTEGQVRDGSYLLQWSALDNVGILEQNQQLVAATATQTQCPDGSPVSAGGSCYETSLFSAQLNVDSTAPTIAITSPTATTYTANQKVASNYKCVDPTPGSGLANCAGPVPTGTNFDTTPNGAGLTPKTFTVNASDKALPANTSAQTISYNVSCHYAAVTLSPTTVNSLPALIGITASVVDCVSTPQKVSVQFTLSGPLGRNCSHSSTVMFTTPAFTIKSGTSSSVTFPFLLAKQACTGQYTVTTTTLQNASTIDSVQSTLTVN